MGRPTKCFEQKSPFLSFNPTTTTSTTTTAYDNYLNYIHIPQDIDTCPSDLVAPPPTTTTTTTSTTSWPYLGGDVYQFAVSGDVCGSIIRYEPSNATYEYRLSENNTIEKAIISAYDVENHYFEQDEIICASSGHLPQIIKGNPTVTLLGLCDTSTRIYSCLGIDLTLGLESALSAGYTVTTSETSISIAMEPSIYSVPEFIYVLYRNSYEIIDTVRTSSLYHTFYASDYEVESWVSLFAGVVVEDYLIDGVWRNYCAGFLPLGRQPDLSTGYVTTRIV